MLIAYILSMVVLVVCIVMAMIGGVLFLSRDVKEKKLGFALIAIGSGIPLGIFICM